MNTEATSGRPASQADVAKLYKAKRDAEKAFRAADIAYDAAVLNLETATLAKARARNQMECAKNAYSEAKVEAGE